MDPTAAPAFVVSADWHVCRSAWANPRGITGDADFALAQVVDLALDLGVPLLAAGDLFDAARPHPHDVRVVRHQVDRLQQAGLPLYFVQGQHERVVDLGGGPATAWLASLADWPTPVHAAAFTAGPFRLFGLDWQPAGRLEVALTAISDPEQYDYVLCHQAWEDLMGGRGGLCDGRLSMVPGRMDVLTGDYHEQCAVAFGDGRVAYSPGALHKLAIDEPDEHAVLVVHADRSVRSHPLRGRYCRHVDLATAAALDDFLANGVAYLDEAVARHNREHDLPAELHTPLVHVRCAGDWPGAAVRLAAAAAGRHHLFLAPPPPAAAPGAAAAPTPLGLTAVLAAYDLGAYPEPERVRADVARLLTGTGPVARVIEELVADFLGELEAKS